MPQRQIKDKLEKYGEVAPSFCDICTEFIADVGLELWEFLELFAEL